MDKWNAPGYTELSTLGSGGFGDVVLARHEESGTLVAVKYLRRELLEDPGFAAMFRDEARVLASIDDPNVVRLYEYLESPSGAAIVMELVDGVSLRDILSRQGKTSPESALVVLQGSLLGLAAAHARGVVHRDYKPANVLVDGAGVSKLTDFGIAIRAGDRAVPAGTLAYAPPEQFRGGPASPAGDVYAATATFYECLTGRPPFTGDTEEALLSAHLSAAVPLEPVPEALRPLVAAGMAKDPRNRPADAASLVTELRAAAAPAYGQDWEERGLFHLGGAALLLAALWPSSTTPAVQGQTVEQVHLSHGSQGTHGAQPTHDPQHLSHADHLRHLEHAKHLQHEHAAHVEHLAHEHVAQASAHSTTNTAARTLTHARRAANLTRRALSAGHGVGAAAAGAAVVAVVVVVALLPSGHKAAPPPPPPPPPPPAAPVTVNGSVEAMAATSDSNVWAVGCAPFGSACDKTLTMHFNGTTWTRVPSPSTGAGTKDFLTAVSVGSASDAWAVGMILNSADVSTASLTLHWNGTAWTQVPNPEGSQTALYGVTAISADDAWAVGADVGDALILHWNGITWTKVPSPAKGVLWDVAATSATNVWAVGLVSLPGATQTLIVHWNGTTWTREQSPSPGTNSNFYHVAVAADGTVWAYGIAGPPPNLSPFVARRVGGTWQAVPLPSPATGNPDSVAVASASNAWVTACANYSANGYCPTLLLHWTGTHLVQEQTPGVDYFDVFALSATDAVALASPLVHGSPQYDEFVLLRWNGTTWR
jgi:serine/threonine-protein kinase